MIDLALFIAAFTTIFVALTQMLEPEIRRKIAIKICLMAAFILTVFAAFGDAVLGFVAISMAGFRVAGGALLFPTALD